MENIKNPVNLFWLCLLLHVLQIGVTLALVCYTPPLPLALGTVSAVRLDKRKLLTCYA